MIRLWRRRQLPTERYRKFWHQDTCYILTGVIWNEEHFVAQFQRYSDYRKKQRML